MFIFKLLLKNAFRHKLRTLLTMVGLVVAISAFGLLQTIIQAWYAGVDGTSNTRLITRSAISVGHPLPRYYAERMERIEGVSEVTWANWFGGIYVDRRNFFARFAVDGESYFKVFPEYNVSDEERSAFMADRQGAVIGRKLAERFGWQVGDTIPLSGTIYPGNWSFTVRGIYASPDPATDENIMLMHWSLLSENLRKRFGSGVADEVALFMVSINDPSRASAISAEIDNLFRNSNAETKTETEKSFQLGMVAMSETVLMAIQTVSFVVVLIIMAVMANTMTMTARERLAEYATLKALGFSPGFVVKLLFGESLMIAVIGGALGIALTFPLAAFFMQQAGTLIKVLEISQMTMMYQASAALFVGLLAAAWPAWKMSRIDIVQGLRHLA